MVMDMGIVYAPDFVINAGGIINCYSEVIGYNRDDAYRKTERIYDVTLDLLRQSALLKRPAQSVAIDIAQARIDSIANIKQRF